ncbi:MAG: chemotaxis protein CheA [Verrucomicrobium sp.]|nr:chemotaxis protein CheA [Verrucomicrobium sp.]
MEKIDRLLKELEKESGYARPGSDDGQLPLREIFANLRDASQDQPELAAFHACAGHAVAHIEGVLDALRPWSEADLSLLGALRAELPLLRADPARPFHPPAAAEAPAPQEAASSAPEPEAEKPILLNLGDGEMLQEFVIESSEHLNQIEVGILRLEERPNDPDTLHAIFRAFHTFKGSAGFLGLEPVKRAAHELENLLDLARQGKLAVTTAVIDVILSGSDLLRQFVVEIQTRLQGRKSGEAIAIPTANLIERVRRVASGEAPAEADAAGAETRPARKEEGGHNIHAAVKVDVAKLDALFDLVGEMVVTQALVAQDPGVRSFSAERLGRNLSHLGRITGDLQKTAMSLRMVPIRSTFQRMQRAVRDLAGKLGKRVDLVLEGEETELDRTLVQEIADPLLHMVRNSVDHGIEMPEERERAGKAPAGTLALRAFQRGGSIGIEIADDGAGLNRERILAKARERGLAAPDAVLSDAEVFQLIFAPGFSTAATVSEVSGRGVGMDVVRRNVEKLRGRIEIASAPGRGSTFTLLLPLTLAIIDGLILRVGEQRYVLPALSVRESIRIAPEMMATVHERHEMVGLRGVLHPLIRLHALFEVPGAVTDPAAGLGVIVEAGAQSGCLLVDELVGKQEIVIKSLGPSLRHVRALSGAAILGDGSVGLILDPAALLQPEREPVAAA